jgi:DNA invertase Pin-like site-specific DNA recombinase
VYRATRRTRPTSDLYRFVTELGEKGVSFKVLDDPLIDTTSRTGKPVMGILALSAEFENDIRREREPQMEWHRQCQGPGQAVASVSLLMIKKEIRTLRESGETVPANIKPTGFSKASVYRTIGQV